jgi:hypothetical protein
MNANRIIAVGSLVRHTYRINGDPYGTTRCEDRFIE